MSARSDLSKCALGAATGIQSLARKGGVCPSATVIVWHESRNRSLACDIRSEVVTGKFCALFSFPLRLGNLQVTLGAGQPVFGLITTESVDMLLASAFGLTWMGSSSTV